MKYYIAGPMTGKEEYNFPAFDAARDMLEAKGAKVFSPADMDRELGFDPKVDGPPDVKFLEEAMRRDLEAIMTVDAMYMLKGWENSTGAKAEHALARWRHILIEYECESGDPKKSAGDKKCPLHLLPTYALEETAWVHKLGADKYGRDNWLDTGVSFDTYHAAIMRHLFAAASGEWLDPESGRPHVAHIAASCNILMDSRRAGKLDC